MKIKEMIKKVEAYNEIAEITGGQKMVLHFYEMTTTEKATEYKQISKFIRETYIKIVADAILDGEYDFETDKVITVTGADGYVHTLTVGFEIYAA